MAEDQSYEEATRLWNEIRFIMWELVQGRIQKGHPLFTWVQDHHMSDQDLAWYAQNRIELDLVGVNYYPQFSLNVIGQETVEQGQIPRAVMGSAEDMIDIARELYQRYHRPIFITETSYNGSEEERVSWLEDVIRASWKMSEEGIELYGVTWFPFLDMVDWPYRTNGLSFKENLATFGLYNLEEQPDGTIYRVKNAAGKRFEEELRAKSVL